MIFSRTRYERYIKITLFLWLLILLPLIMFLFPGCSQNKKGNASPNVVVITIDTLRSDHLGCYGYGRNTSPNIDALAKKATFYTRSVASSSWTVPTHASLFTGKFAFEHGAHAFEVKTKTQNNVNPMPAGERTLAEVFFDEGYTTGAFVANSAYLGPRWQLDQGFEVYHVDHVYSDKLNDKVCRWLDKAAKRPFFLFINYIDTHRSYNIQRKPGLHGIYVAPDPNKQMDKLYHAVMPGIGAVPARLAQIVIDQYDNAIRNVDEQLGRLIERLKQLGIYDNTIIVLTSDHGEFFGEHNLVEHSKDIYEEVVLVPLIVKNPFQTKGKVVEITASSTDIPHLVLSQFKGRNWIEHLKAFPDAPGNHEIITEIYFTRPKDLFHPKWGHRFKRIRTAIYDWPYKFILSSDGNHELYDLENDQRESRNLMEGDPAAAEPYKTRLQDFFGSRARSRELVDQKPLSEKERRVLKSLGYIGD